MNPGLLFESPAFVWPVNPLHLHVQSFSLFVLCWMLSNEFCSYSAKSQQWLSIDTLHVERVSIVEIIGTQQLKTIPTWANTRWQRQEKTSLERHMKSLMPASSSDPWGSWKRWEPVCYSYAIWWDQPEHWCIHRLFWHLLSDIILTAILDIFKPSATNLIIN